MGLVLRGGGDVPPPSLVRLLGVPAADVVSSVFTPVIAIPKSMNRMNFKSEDALAGS